MRDNVDDEQTTDKRIPYRAPLWMAFYWRDFMDIVFGLKRPEDVGLYAVMMGLAWLRGDASIPGDMKELKQLLRSKMPDLHGHTFNRAVPMLLERFFERVEDGRFIHKGVENELRLGRKLTANRKQTASKHQTNARQIEATSNKINGLQTPTIQDNTNIKIREDTNREAWRGSEVDRKKVRNGFHSLAHHLRRDGVTSKFIPSAATSETTDNLKDFREVELGSAPAGRFDRH